MKHESLCNLSHTGKEIGGVLLQIYSKYTPKILDVSYLLYLEFLWFYYNHCSEKHLRDQIERKKVLFDSQLDHRSSRSIPLQLEPQSWALERRNSLAAEPMEEAAHFTAARKSRVSGRAKEPVALLKATPQGLFL